MPAKFHEGCGGTTCLALSLALDELKVLVPIVNVSIMLPVLFSFRSEIFHAVST